jgi:hypothetical protein
LVGWEQAQHLAEQLSDAVLRDLTPDLATMSDADVIALCRAAIDQTVQD